MGADRPLLRLRALRLPAGHHHDRQGDHLGVRPAGRDDRLRPRRRAVPARARELRPRLHLRRASARDRGRAREHRPDRARGPLRARARQGARVPRDAGVRCATSRSSATCAAPASSRRSSWSRTARPRRPSTTRSPSTCCAASSPGALYHHGLICRADDRGDPVDPARAAADRRHRAVRRDRAGAAHRADAPRASCLLGDGDADRPGSRRRDGARARRGERAASAPIRWVHVSELADPTPWLSGGELLLSTGMALLDARLAARLRPPARRAPARRAWASASASRTTTLPAALVEEARALDFPLFAVPYEMPFIAITERAFTSLVDEQLDVLQRAVAIQRRMERLVLEERSLGEVVRGLANSIGATVMVLDAAGRPLASHAFRRELDAALVAAIGAEVAARSRGGEPQRLRAADLASSPGARSRCRCRAARARPRRRGWSRCPRATASPTTSASSPTTR